MEFVGREAELDALSDWWEHAADRPALVWGRRRVGKTALIEHFASGLPRVVFHTGVGDPMPGELVRLSAGVAGGQGGGARGQVHKTHPGLGGAPPPLGPNPAAP